jgi:vacuolar protein sorting-associated protein 35
VYYLVPLNILTGKLIFLFDTQGACVKKLSSKGKLDDSKATKQIVALLSAPLEKYNDIVTILKLSNYPHVPEYLDIETNKIMATVIIQSTMKNNTRIATADNVCFSTLFMLIFPICSRCPILVQFYSVG